MRRFEFSEGSSNKFWEVDVEGSAVTVRFGKIGTQGQTQLKSLPSFEAAERQAEKLIAEKVAKGYVEIGGVHSVPAVAPAPAPAPAPTPVAAPAPVAASASSESGAVRWTPEQRAKVYPRRGAVKPSKPLSLEKLWGEVLADYQTAAKCWQWSTSPRGPLPTIDLYATPPDGPLDAQWEATVATLFGVTDSYTAPLRPSTGENLVRYWAAKESPGFAVRVLCELLTLCRENGWNVKRGGAAKVTERRGYCSYLLPGPWLAGRRLIASLDDAEYAKARAAAVTLRKDLERALFVSFMFPDEAEWANDCAERVLVEAKKDPENAYLWKSAVELLLTSLSDVARARPLFEEPLNVELRAAFVPTMIDNLGAAAAAVLARDRIALGDKKEGGAESAVQALAMIETPEAAAILAELADEAGAVASVTEWAQRLPELARPALAARAAAERNSQAAKLVKLLEGAPPARAKAAAAPAPTKAPAIAPVAPRIASAADLDLTERVVIPDVERARLLLPSRARRDTAAVHDVSSSDEHVAVIEGWASAHGFAGMLRRVVEWGQSKDVVFEHNGKWGGRFGEDVFRCVRTRMSEASDADYAEALAYARSVDASAQAPLQSFLAFTFPDESGFVPPEIGEDSRSPLLLASVRDAVALARVAETAAKDTAWGGAPVWVASSFREHAVANVVDVLGVDALPHLERMLAEADQYIASQKPKPAHVELYRRAYRTPVLAGFAWIESRASLKRAIAEMGDWSRRPVAWELAKRRPALALAAALELAGDKKSAPFAKEMLAWLHHEHGDLVAKLRPTFSPADQKALDAARVEGDLPPWLVAPPAHWKAPKAPGFWAPALLPAIELRAGGTLSTTHLETLRAVLTLGFFGAQIELEQLRAIATPESLAAFASALFRAWLDADGPAKEKWAFCGPGWLGGDRYATEIAPLIREWPGQRLSARAEIGLEVLENVGTDLALMHLSGIAEKSKFEGITKAARERIAAVAQRRGLTPDELADRLVPHLELPAGALDLEKGKGLPKEAKAVVQHLRVRFEATMCNGRAVAADTFRPLFVEHPLVGQFARRVLWLELRADGTRAAFRVAEDGSFADAEDRAHELAPASRVAIAHPIDLAADEVARFAQVFADYRIVQPFEQLGRFVARDEAAVNRALASVVGKKVKKAKVQGLVSRGWRRGPVEDGGFVPRYERVLGGQSFTIHFGDLGMAVGAAAADDDEVEIDSVSPDAARMDARLRSELARDLTWLGEK